MKNRNILKNISGIFRPGITLGISLFLIILSLEACAQEKKEKEQKQETISQAPVSTFTIPIQGMSCGACVSNVKKTVKSLDGVTDVEVSLENREAKITYNNKKISPEDVQKAINGLGYKAGKPVEAKE